MNPLPVSDPPIFVDAPGENDPDPPTEPEQIPDDDALEPLEDGEGAAHEPSR